MLSPFLSAFVPPPPLTGKVWAATVAAVLRPTADNAQYLDRLSSSKLAELQALQPRVAKEERKRGRPLTDLEMAAFVNGVTGGAAGGEDCMGV